MAVGATDLALCYLEENSIPRLMHCEVDHVVAFRRRIAMVEVKDYDVRLAAIDAGMSPKVLADERTVLGAIPSDPRDFLPDIGFAVTDVVLAPIRRMTDTTTPLASAPGLAVKCEVVNRL
jgi:hypothetical protein